MLVNLPVPFDIVGIRGVKNHEKERVIIRASADVDMVDYILFGAYSENQKAIFPLNRFYFWFPQKRVKKGEYVRLYTKEGINVTVNTNLDGKPAIIHNFFWGFRKDWTLWGGDFNTVIILELNRWKAMKVL